MALTLDSRSMHARPRELERVLRPLRPGQPLMCAIVDSRKPGSRAIAADPGPVSGDECCRDAVFQTFAPDVWCQYHELWNGGPGSPLVSLGSMYLNTFTVELDTQKRRDLVLIHCEPPMQPADARGTPGAGRKYT